MRAWRGGPNTALQRTRLRAPLSFKTLGARCSLGAVVLVLSTMTTIGCHKGPSLEDFRSRLSQTAGADAVDCGLARLGASKASAVSCATAALAAHRPVFVVFQTLGMDSDIFRGLAVDDTNRAIELTWDGDVWGGSHIAKESRIFSKLCNQPLVVDDENPIRCSAFDGA